MAGRPQIEPTEEQRSMVLSMASYGIPQAEVATAVGMAKGSLRKHFRGELDAALTHATHKVAQSLYQQAIGGNVTACIFWLKSKAGWVETNRHEVTGKDEQPFVFTLNLGGSEREGEAPDA